MSLRLPGRAIAAATLLLLPLSACSDDGDANEGDAGQSEIQPGSSTSPTPSAGPDGVTADVDSLLGPLDGPLASFERSAPYEEFDGAGEWFGWLGMTRSDAETALGPCGSFIADLPEGPVLFGHMEGPSDHGPDRPDFVQQTTYVAESVDAASTLFASMDASGRVATETGCSDGDLDRPFPPSVSDCGIGATCFQGESLAVDVVGAQAECEFAEGRRPSCRRILSIVSRVGSVVTVVSLRTRADRR